MLYLDAGVEADSAGMKKVEVITDFIDIKHNLPIFVSFHLELPFEIANLVLR